MLDVAVRRATLTFTFQSGDIQIKQHLQSYRRICQFTFQSGDIQIVV